MSVPLSELYSQYDLRASRLACSHTLEHNLIKYCYLNIQFVFKQK